MKPTTHSQSISAIACAPGALPGGPVRTRFFDGMFLTQADLETEQRFWRLKRRLTNRALGDGVVWGLKLAWNKATHRFSLSPGYAVDCCGNDLVVECPVEITEAELWSRSDPSLRRPIFQREPATVDVPPIDDSGLHTHDRRAVDGRRAIDGKLVMRHACVVLQYTECPEEARPVHRDACAGVTSFCEPSRVRETARLLLVPPPTKILTPPEKFLDELKAWANSLPASIRDALFPPQSGPAPTPAATHVPMHVNVTVPGSTPAASTQQPPPSGATTPVALTGLQTPTANRRTGVVTFELTPDIGWGFTAGTVLDQTRIVETVTPPSAPSMFWSFDLALPANARIANASFDFHVDKLNLAQMFGGTRQGIVELRITGDMVVADQGNGNVRVDVTNLVITTVRADVTEGKNEQGCFREVVPWGWTIDPTNGRKIASTLLLSAMYGFLSEVVRRGSAPQWQVIARVLYIVTWYALFGAFPMANVAEEHRRKLAELILDLYKRWCDGLAYPGPRCTDEHHGIYLGCAELDRAGNIVSFDMWAHRRYVVTGALLDHWAHQFGVAPLDVIVGRFARAFCCVASLEPIVMPPRERGVLLPGYGGEKADERFHVGTRVSAEAFAKLHGADLRWVSHAELAARTPEAFMRRDTDGRLDVLASQIEEGGTIAIAVPVTAKTIRGGAIRDATNTLTRRGEARVREAGREAIADFVATLFGAALPVAVLAEGTPQGTAKVARQLSEIGARLSDVVEGGTEGVRSWLGGTAVDAASVSDLVDRAEVALDTTVITTVKVLGPALERASFAERGSQEKLASAIVEHALPRVDKAVVISAAKTAAGR